MARDDANITTALASDEVYLFNAIELNLDNSNLRFWTGYGHRSLGDAFSVSQIVVGDLFEIASVGTTDFTLVGASANTVGETFFATDIPVGTGTVKKAFTGTGDIMKIDGIDEVSDLTSNKVSVAFSGVNSDFNSIALAEAYQRRNAAIYFGVGQSPYYHTEVFSGEIDQMNITDSADVSTIELTIVNRLIKLERANIRRYTSQSHRARHRTDNFFDSVIDIQDTDIVWGR